MVRIEGGAAQKPVHQRQAAVLALWRWRAPVLAFELDAEWGVDRSVLESLFRLAAAPAGEPSDRAYRRNIAELCTAPLFTSEVDPDTVQLFQLETIGNLLTFGELLDKAGVDEAERVVETSAGLATYLDALVGGSFHSHPSEEAHRRYLADLADLTDRASEGYFASRHLAVVTACHGALADLPESAGLLDSSTGRELLALCEDFGEEVVMTMRWLRMTGH
ncbi:hypothetical protein GCM10018781_02210 [Kitasatospora indigofera]|uniref:Uncharacterized protein n=1 Tax=Kitasatospora indigofera TaxID=67307 RepID=A0A919FAX9_9ACTN|nr:hypothetical protein [Kitasatospora indigofera]GHH59279.1 hypothetical protein GCM10018781_02210 [Kitasatospora indigofera]